MDPEPITKTSQSPAIPAAISHRLRLRACNGARTRAVEPRLAIDSPFHAGAARPPCLGVASRDPLSGSAVPRRAVNDPQGLPRHLGKPKGAALGWDHPRTSPRKNAQPALGQPRIRVTERAGPA